MTQLKHGDHPDDGPILVLGRLVRTDEAWPDDDFIERDWYTIDHQTGGVSCTLMKIAGTVLKPKPEVLAKMHELSDDYCGSEIWKDDATLVECVKYNETLKKLFGAHCNSSFREFHEAWYPIDLDCLSLMTDEKLPNNLDDLIHWKNELHKGWGCVGRWRLVILGENSD